MTYQKKPSQQPAEKLVAIEPPQVSFMYNSKEVSPTTITITNISNSPVAFKVKTNAAQSYIVKPNLYQLPPGEKVIVSITPKSDIPTVCYHCSCSLNQ